MLPDRICVLQDSLEASFKDQLDQDIRQSQFEDNICVLYFYETGCEDTACQQLMNELSRIQTEYIDDQEVKIFAIALKDELNSLELKQRIARSYDAIPEKWYFLDTDTAGLKELYYEQLALPWSNDDSSVLNPEGMIVLLDHLGGFRGLYEGRYPKKIDRLMADIILVQKWRKVKKKEASRQRKD